MIAAAKVALDQFLYVPFVFFPAFYTVDAVVRREEPVLLAARDRYLREIWRTCVDTWPFSIAAQFVGFRFVPSHLLIPYVTCCSFVFTGLVSGLQGKFRLRVSGSRHGPDGWGLDRRGVGRGRPFMV